MGYRELRTFRATRRKTLASVEGLRRRQLEFSPGRGKWCLAEVLDHLTRVDRIFRRDLEELVAMRRRRKGRRVFLMRGMRDFDVSLPGVPKAFVPLLDLPVAALGAFVPRQLRQGVARSRLVPARAPRILVPRKGRQGDDLRAELHGMLEFTGKLFADRETRFGRLYYYNPLTGFTSALGILSFTASHESRHQEQMADILAAEGFPGPARLAASGG